MHHPRHHTARPRVPPHNTNTQINQNIYIASIVYPEIPRYVTIETLPKCNFMFFARFYGNCCRYKYMLFLGGSTTLAERVLRTNNNACVTSKPWCLWSLQLRQRPFLTLKRRRD